MRSGDGFFPPVLSSSRRIFLLLFPYLFFFFSGILWILRSFCAHLLCVTAEYTGTRQIVQTQSCHPVAATAHRQQFIYFCQTAQAFVISLFSFYSIFAAAAAALRPPSNRDENGILFFQCFASPFYFPGLFNGWRRTSQPTRRKQFYFPDIFHAAFAHSMPRLWQSIS